MMKYLFSDRVWVEGVLQRATICMEEDRISSILDHRHPGAVDYSGSVIMPGAIDVHVHINEPGRTDWEGFHTATRAAARGGTTTLIDMPLNSSPVVTTTEAFEQKIHAAQGKLWVNTGFWAGAIGQDPNDVVRLIEAGCFGVKVFLSNSGIDEFPNISAQNLELLMRALSDKDIPVLAHCELDTLPPGSPINKDPRVYANYLASRPKSWENEAIKMFAKLCKEHHCKAHIVHLASDEILPWLRTQKMKQTPLTVETCPHYLFFCSEEIEDGNTLLKCAPPIRSDANRKHLLKGIKEGIIDFLATDHSPAPPNLKAIDTGDFVEAWGGISGLQFLLSASWTALKNSVTLEQFIPLITDRPAKFLGLASEIGKIAPGYKADFCVWNPEATFKVMEENIEHRHKESPYLDKTLHGTIQATYVNGLACLKEGKWQKHPPGRILLKTKSQDA